jgi:hypothetical protein
LAFGVFYSEGHFCVLIPFVAFYIVLEFVVSLLTSRGDEGHKKVRLGIRMRDVSLIQCNV